MIDMNVLDVAIDQFKIIVTVWSVLCMMATYVYYSAR